MIVWDTYSAFNKKVNVLRPYVCTKSRTPVFVLHPYIRTVLRSYVHTVLHPFVPISNMYVCTPLHRLSKSEIKEGRRTCSAFLLNDFSHKRLSEGVTNCAIVMALNVSIRAFSPCFSLTMSLRLAI